jgi:hypothetical protein
LRRRLSSGRARVAAPTDRLCEQTRALCGVEGDAGLVQVVERETGRAAATDTGAAIFHGVVAGMATALGLTRSVSFSL